MHLLLIEDNPDLVGNLSDFFESRGHTVDIAQNGPAGLSFGLAGRYDVIVLDLMLPGMDGLEVCARLREARVATPVLMLTARDTLADKLEGFGRGADDYLVKPFALPELEARLTALARRARGETVRCRLAVADLTLDPETLRVERGGRRIELAPIPLRILEVLMRRSPAVVRRGELEREVWGDDPPDSDALRAHIHILRSAVDREAEVALVRTVRGIGYQLVAPDER
ncbi:response regulator with CheY-like receiver domain and winged-helix DNA-binding domain [Thioflavicoccus mobilis 8321]|uniref:Response regulator with CheY-like receiver domain and winged-helix DNA-binding domain n=1 Tax=Thioflavicoccus mobilis 8321 TaxID=765912 RepID=L0GUP6_9GAMM|nr:response regulator transcription factor [Thioflavicoccus mobilis]AGA89090.1 response regulator with CheY-like receiver domain and winged-helix DNA-binding domain [Thioflavicoccus mobilis 8321]